MLLDDDSAKLATINTRKMDTILQGIPNVLCYLDDILVTSTSEADHLSHLEEVLRRLQEKGICLRRDKRHFFQSSVTYLGHYTDAKGITHQSRRLKLSKMLQFYKM